MTMEKPLRVHILQAGIERRNALRALHMRPIHSSWRDLVQSAQREETVLPPK